MQISIAKRFQHLKRLQGNPKAQAIELELCRRDPLYWFDHWPWTYDPRADPAYVPFDLFSCQRQMVKWLQRRLKAKDDGLLEKSRDMGFTWVIGGFAWHHWRWTPGFKTTFGSRKMEYVDRLGDPDSIFEKIRLLMRSLPLWMMPKDWQPKKHDNSMLLINPENGNTIRGEGGDEMGRGGRSTLYVIDEAAYIERADRVDASTSSNSDTRIWASSVCGMENLFARKRFGGQLRSEQIFRLHWSMDPRKSPEWAVSMQSKMEPHVWASEYEIDYAASVEGTCIPAAWVESAKRTAEVIKDLKPLAEGIGGGDIGAGKAKSVFVARFGPVVLAPRAWLDPDTIDTALKLLDHAGSTITKRGEIICRIGTLRYDSVGVGQGITAVMKRNRRHGLIVIGVNVGEPPTDVIWPDGETSKEKFANLKAEAWWQMRERFKLTHEAVQHALGNGGHPHPAADLIALPAGTVDCQQLAAQLPLVRWTRNERGKIMIETKKALSERGVASPDYADALALTFAGNARPLIIPDSVLRWSRQKTR